VQNIGVIQSRLDHLAPQLRDALKRPLEQALVAAQSSQLGLALAYLEKVRDLLDGSDHPLPH
jgi:hypothetical protein